MKTPAVLHLQIGGDNFLGTMLDKFEVEGWNRWLNATIDRLPLSWWGEHEDEPPIHLEFDVESADLSGRTLDGIDLGLVSCEGADFSRASAVGAMFACVRHASFRDADIRDAIFTGDISATDFTDARLDNASFADAYFHADDPPKGVPLALLQGCCLDHDDESTDWATSAVGLTTYPVAINASLSESAHIK